MPVAVFPNIDPSDVNAKVIYFDDGRALFAVPSTPEGVLAVAPGNLAVDTTAGVLYVKASAASLNTGWVMLGSVAIGGAITGATQGSVLFAGPGGILAQDNTNLFWDDTNNRLGLGNNTPPTRLFVQDSGSVDLARFLYNNAPDRYFRISSTGGSTVVLEAVTSNLNIGSSGDDVVQILRAGIARLVIGENGNIGIATSVFNGSAGNTLTIFQGAPPSAGVANALQLNSHDIVAGTTTGFAIGESGKVARITDCITRITTQFSVANSATPAQVTEDGAAKFGFDLEANTAYSFEYYVEMTSNLAVGCRLQFDGTVTFSAFKARAVTFNAGTITQQAAVAAFNLLILNNTANSTQAYAMISGSITTTAAGTLFLEFSQNVSNVTASTVEVGSFGVLHQR
jgi:hypothetical protein